MNCSKTKKLISPYIDGELSEGKKKDLETHIRLCEECRTEMEETQKLKQLFVDRIRIEAPPGFHTRVMANVDIARPGGLFGVPITVRFAEAFVVFLLIVAGAVSGTFLVRGFMPGQAGDAVASLHLDVFESAPPGTLGGAFLAMTESGNEK